MPVFIHIPAASMVCNTKTEREKKINNPDMLVNLDNITHVIRWSANTIPDLYEEDGRTRRRDVEVKDAEFVTIVFDGDNGMDVAHSYEKVSRMIRVATGGKS